MVPSPVICVNCRLPMRCTKNERALEVLCAGDPYQLWSGDQFQCPQCGVSVLTGFGREPLADAGQDPNRYAAMKQFELDHGGGVVTLNS